MLQKIIGVALALRSVTAYYNSGNNHYYNPYGRSNSRLSVCDNSVVRMTFLSSSCNSPYTFYYGNGGNRNSETCNYGDTMNVLGTVRVVDNLQYGEDIFLTLGIYDDESNLVFTIKPTYFCQDFIGGDCTRQGTYSFETNLKLGTPDGKDRRHFYPLIQFAFSSQMDYGTNLGAANMECPGRDNNGLVYAPWSNKNMQLSPGKIFFARYGILLGTCAVLFLFALFVWTKAEQDDDIVVGLGAYESYEMEGNYTHRGEDEKNLYGNSWNR
jgi:hypothetical protein